MIKVKPLLKAFDGTSSKPKPSPLIYFKPTFFFSPFLYMNIYIMAVSYTLRLLNEVENETLFASILVERLLKETCNLKRPIFSLHEHLFIFCGRKTL